ncbi:MAG: hypothetical protein EA406_04505 [Rhodospirillales bacterium]|nr:MAG: hypothetical protein EA406_04505 [Rhodospirillales bacterium]
MSWYGQAEAKAIVPVCAYTSPLGRFARTTTVSGPPRAQFDPVHRLGAAGRDTVTYYDQPNQGPL